MRALAVALTLLAACISPDLVPCGDNSCPQGTICLDGSRCVTQVALDACSGSADGTLCTLDSTAGICADGACTVARCGDGIVAPGEGCDGAVASGMDCSYFGYYRGSLTCSDTCQLDTSACSGRCGDGITDVDQGEYCDGAAPAGSSCRDFGYDMGALTCGLSCGPDLVTCEHFGWETSRLSADAVPQWGGHGWLAGIDSSTGAWVFTSAVVVAPGSGYALTAGTQTTVWAAGNSALASWTSGGGWVSLVPPWTSDAGVTSMWASDALGAFVSVSNDPRLWHYDGTSWSQLAGPWLAGAHFGSATDLLYVAWVDAGGFDELVSWDGSAATPIGLPYPSSLISPVVADARGQLWANYGPTGVVEYEGAGVWSQPINVLGTSVITGWSIAAFDDGVAIAQSTQIQGVQAFGVSLYGSSHPQSIPWNSGSLVSDGVGLYAGNQWAFAAWTDEGSFGDKGLVAHEIVGGPFTFSSFFTTFDVLDNTNAWSESSSSCDLLEISGSGHTFCVASGTLNDGGVAVGVSAVTDVWGAADDSAAAAVGDHTFAVRGNGAWTVGAAAVAFSEVGGYAANDVYAVGLGDGDTDARLWHYDGSSWLEVTPVEPTLSNLVITPSVVYALTGGQLLAYQRSTATAAVSGVAGAFSSLTGGGVDDDLFATGGPTGVMHFDGTTWWPITVPAGPEAILANGDQLLLQANSLKSSEMYRLQRWRPW